MFHTVVLGPGSIQLCGILQRLFSFQPAGRQKTDSMQATKGDFRGVCSGLHSVCSHSIVLNAFSQPSNFRGD